MKLSDIFAKSSTEQEARSKLSPEAMQDMFPMEMVDRILSVVDEITMEKMAQIFSSAESGSINHLIEAYIKMEHSDSRLQGLINSRRNASSSMKFNVVSPDQHKEAGDFVEHNLNKLDINSIVKDMLDGRMYGAAFFEKIWHIKEIDGYHYGILKSIDQIDHSKIEMEMGEIGDRYGRLYLLSNFTNKLYIDQVNPLKIIPCVNTTKRGYYDYAGVMRTVARWYIVKAYILKSWVQFTETYGFPVTTVKMPQSEFEKSRKLITKILRSVGSQRWGVFFDNMDYELHQASMSGTVDTFEKLIALCNTEMAIAITGQNLTSEVTGGSYAAAQTHKEILDSIIDDDLSWIQGIINSYIVNDIVRVNFPEIPEDEYPKVECYIPKQVNRQEVARGLNEASRLIDIPKQWAYEQLQIPTPEDGEETIGKSGGNLLDEIGRA